MDLAVTIYLFIAESIFFSALLIVCLKMASNKHRAHLKKLTELIGKSEEKVKTERAEKVSIEDIRKKLFDQISKLQIEISELNRVKQKYGRLKIRYTELKNAHERLKLESTQQDGKDLTARKMDSVTNAESSSNVAQEKVKNYEEKISELKNIISNLKKSLQQYNLEKSEIMDSTYASIDNLSDSISESEKTTENVKISLDKLKEELEIYKGRVFELENQQKTLNNNTDPSNQQKPKYTIISKPGNNEDVTDNNLEKESIESLKELQQEVYSLRKATSDQRSIIFELEKQLTTLKTELKENNLDDKEREEKELELKALANKLTETEGCIDILESEINYLSQKLAEMEEHPLKEINQENDREIDDLISSHPPIMIKNQVKNIVDSAKSAAIDSILELITAEILSVVEALNIDIYLSIKSSLGEIETSTKEDWAGSIKSELDNRIKTDKFFSQTIDGLLIISHYHIGVLISHKIDNQKTCRPIEDTEEVFSIIILVANAAIGYLESRKKSASGNKKFRQAVDIARTDAEKISIQQIKQATETRKILNNFLIELNTSLNTMNITENQSMFFDKMVKEVINRIESLDSSDTSVETDVSDMIAKLEKSGESLFH